MLKLPTKKYQIIYADPPWRYAASGCLPRSTALDGRDDRPDKPYESMSLEDIKYLDVKAISHDNCLLFLWITSPLLYQAI